jgi:hypothetical protein
MSKISNKLIVQDIFLRQLGPTKAEPWKVHFKISDCGRLATAISTQTTSKPMAGNGRGVVGEVYGALGRPSGAKVLAKLEARLETAGPCS